MFQQHNVSKGLTENGNNIVKICRFIVDLNQILTKSQTKMEKNGKAD